MRTAEEFALAAAARQIARWDTHTCVICGYRCGYVFADGVVGYDPGCYCVGGGSSRERTWDDVADHYNMQGNPDIIARYDAFWGFETTPSETTP